MTTPWPAGLLWVTALALGFEWWLLRHFRRQGHGIELRLAALELGGSARRPPESAKRGPSPQPIGGLPARSILNDFELADLRGGNVTLSQWRGRRIAVLFVQPECAHSRRLLATVISEHMATAERVQTVFVSTGEPELNLELFAGVSTDTPALLQRGTELARVWRISATPSAYVIDAAGVTEGRLLRGADDILDALRIESTSTAAGEHREEPSRGVSGATTPPTPSFPTAARPLAIGASAPDVELALLSGGRLGFAAGGSRRTLALFSDPACAPCRELAPELDARFRRSPGSLQLVMLCRGGDASVRAFVERHGLSHPVAIQADGGLARAFGMMASPSAILLDGEGRVLEEPAVGKREILSLVDRAMAASAEIAGAGLQ
ncbi:MAG: redoxin domain-containing protein [Thermomicrobiales bacterium]